MLSPNSYADYLTAYRLAQTQACSGTHKATPSEILARPNGRISGNDLIRLARSLDIAAHLDEVPLEAAQCADLIGRSVQGTRCPDFSDIKPWSAALQWASDELRTIPPDHQRRTIMTRQFYVAESCKRLRADRHSIPLSSDGPFISRQTCTAIGRGIDSLANLIGGQFILGRVFAELRHSRFYDGFWLFGDKIPPVNAHKSPSMPWGYLLSLGLKHIGTRSTARKPDVAWNSLVNRATDLATVLDCERYNQFDGMFLSDSDFFPAIAESLLWREVFTLPQVPPIVISTLKEAFSSVLTEQDRALHPINFDVLFQECELLLSSCSNEAPTIFHPDHARHTFPLLFKMATGKRGLVNQQYVDPLGATFRNQDRLIFFELPDRNVLVLNRTLTASAMCEVVFRTLWDGRIPRGRANNVSGAVLEKSIAIGCRQKVTSLVEHAHYNVGRDVFELDVATRNKDQIIFFETKAKSLTAEARSIDAAKFLTDYADSYLELLQQLARHEKHALAGLIPLVQATDDPSALRYTKIAVSPLSYGPAADKPLAAQLVQAMATFSLQAVGGDAKLATAVDKYNTAKQRAVSLVADIAPKNRDGLPDLNAYLIHVFWLDLGQLLYSLDRATTAVDAFSPLRHLTFATRDFWTELAFADAGNLLRGKWKPVP